jgi:hypothetical protein
MRTGETERFRPNPPDATSWSTSAQRRPLSGQECEHHNQDTYSENHIAFTSDDLHGIPAAAERVWVRLDCHSNDPAEDAVEQQDADQGQ